MGKPTALLGRSWEMPGNQPKSPSSERVRSDLEALVSEGLWDVSQTSIDYLMRLSIFQGSDAAPASVITFRAAFRDFLTTNDELAGAFSEMAMRLFGVQVPYREQTATGRTIEMGKVRWLGREVLYDAARRPGGRRDRVLDRVTVAIVLAEEGAQEAAPSSARDDELAVATGNAPHTADPLAAAARKELADGSGPPSSWPRVISGRSRRVKATVGLVACVALALGGLALLGGGSNGGHIKAKSAGNSGLDAAAVAEPDLRDKTPPSTPTALTARALGHSQVQLSWRAASDNVGVVAYVVYRNGDPIPLAAVSGSKTSYRDASTTPGGEYMYEVLALDQAGNQSVRRAHVTVVTPGTRGLISPMISLTAPTTGASVSGRVTLSATVHDNLGLLKVGFTVKGTGVSLDLAGARRAVGVGSQYVATWNTAAVPNGPYAVRAYGLDAGANGISSGVATVIVSGSRASG